MKLVKMIRYNLCGNGQGTKGVNGLACTRVHPGLNSTRSKLYGNGRFEHLELSIYEHLLWSCDYGYG